MRFLSALALTLLLTLSATWDGRAQEPLAIGWGDLVPPAEPLVDPFDGLENRVRFDLGLISDIRIQNERGYLHPDDPNIEYAEQLVEKLRAKGVDVDTLLEKDRAFLDKLEEQSRKLVEALDGELVSLPGYALPLEFTDKAVDRFLLVPYVGACIHTPPPPPNQLLVVELSEPHRFGDIYEPVIVTGRLHTKRAESLLNFVDGETQVESGYEIDGMKIEPFKIQ